MDDKVESMHHHEAASSEQEVVAERKLSVTTNPHLEAILQTSKPNQWGSGYLQLYFICLLIFFCSTMNGA